MAHSAIMSVRITGNSDDAVKAFQKATSKAAAFGSFMGGVALKGVTALWNTVKGFAGDVANMSDSTDKFVSTMNFAGIDTGNIEKASKAARDYADRTVYDLSTIQNTTAQLAANGISDYTGLTEAAGNLNAVAGGNADTFKSVAMVLTQTAGAGKLTTENWNQLADAIPGASGKLQDAMKANGAYTGNFRDAMADGQITADEFNQALKQLGMSQVAKEAASSTKTMEGALGNLEASITGGLTDAFNIIKPTVTSALTSAADTVTWFSGKATGAIKGLMAFIGSGDITGDLLRAFGIEEDNPILGFLLDLRTQAVDTFATAKRNVGDFINGFMATGPVQAAMDLFSRLGDTVAGLVGGVKAVAGEFLQVFESMGAGLGGAAGMGDKLGAAFNGALQVVGFVVDKLGAFGDWVAEHADPISAALVGIGAGFAAFKTYTAVATVVDMLKGFSLATEVAAAKQWLLNAAMNANPVLLVVTAISALVAALAWFFTQTETGRQLWQQFMDWLATIWQNVQEAWQTAWNAISQFLTDTWNAITAFMEPIIAGITQFITDNMDTIQAIWQGVWGAISTYFTGIWNGIKICVETVINVIRGIIQTVTAVINGDWQGAWNGIKSIFTGIWDGMKAFVKNALDTIKGVIVNVLAAVGADWRGVWNNIGNFFTGIWNGMRNAASNGVNQVVDFVRGLPQRILDALGNVGDLLWNAGASILSGFLNGLKSTWSKVTGWIGGIGDWIKDHKGPISYDRRLLVPAGNAIMTGFAQGLQSGFDSTVRGTIGTVNRRLASTSLAIGMAGVSGSTVVNKYEITVSGIVTDPDATAKQIIRLIERREKSRR